jgi:hypothetical protein
VSEEESRAFEYMWLQGCEERMFRGIIHVSFYPLYICLLI